MNEKNTNDFEPNIISFCCQWCSYAAADQAGSLRLEYPANVKIIKIPCTGRIALIHLLQAIENGADGVFLSGCLPGDCHYVSGNDRAANVIEYAKKLFEEIGIEPERVHMYYNAASMAPQFSQTCKDFTEIIRKLGPTYRRKEKLAA